MSRRTVRKADVTSALTARDLALLAFVARAGPVTTEHVRSFGHLSLAMARRRLRALFDHGALSIRHDAQEEPNRYVITKRGQNLALEKGLLTEDALRQLRGQREANPHHEGAVELYVSLADACRRVGVIQLERFLFEADIRRLTPAARGALIPDAVAVIARADGGAREAYAIEIDRGTEKNPSWVAQRKGLPYAELRKSGRPLAGCPEWRVLCVVLTERRRNRLAQAVYDLGVPDGLWFFALEGNVGADHVLRPVWHTARLAPDGSAARLLAESPFAGVITDRDHRNHALGAESANDFKRVDSSQMYSFAAGRER